MSSCLGCVSDSKEESQKNSATKFEEDGTVEVAEFEDPKDFGTCPKCGAWVDRSLQSSMKKTLKKEKIFIGV